MQAWQAWDVPIWPDEASIEGMFQFDEEVSGIATFNPDISTLMDQSQWWPSDGSAFSSPIEPFAVLDEQIDAFPAAAQISPSPLLVPEVLPQPPSFDTGMVQVEVKDVP